MPRKKKTIATIDAGNLEKIAIDQTIMIDKINEEQLQQLSRAVGADMLAIALDRAGPGASLSEVQVQLQVMLS